MLLTIINNVEVRRQTHNKKAKLLYNLIESNTKLFREGINIVQHNIV